MPAPHNAYSPATNATTHRIAARSSLSFAFIYLLLSSNFRHDNSVPFGVQRLQPTVHGWASPQPVRMRRPASGPLQSQRCPRNLDARLVGECAFQHVALPSSASRSRPQAYRLTRRGLDAPAEDGPPRRGHLSPRSLG